MTTDEAQESYKPQSALSHTHTVSYTHVTILYACVCVYMNGWMGDVMLDDEGQ